MRDELDQISGLKRCADLAAQKHPGRVRAGVVWVFGDTPNLRLVNMGRHTGLEIVFAADGYDEWRDGRLRRTNMSIEEAAELILTEAGLGGDRN